AFIFGGLFEVLFNETTSFEANLLHRPMKFTINYTEIYEDGEILSSSMTRTAVRAWEFPLLFKYTLPGGRVRPFIAAGPSFRTQEDASATEPSQFGVSAGVGIAIRLASH